MKTDEWNGSRCLLLIFLALPWETTGKKWQLLSGPRAWENEESS